MNVISQALIKLRQLSDFIHIFSSWFYEKETEIEPPVYRHGFKIKLSLLQGNNELGKLGNGWCPSYLNTNEHYFVFTIWASVKEHY